MRVACASNPATKLESHDCALVCVSQSFSLWKIFPTGVGSGGEIIHCISESKMVTTPPPQRPALRSLRPRNVFQRPSWIDVVHSALHSCKMGVASEARRVPLLTSVLVVFLLYGRPTYTP